jgi:hypothetical protein
MPAKQRKAIAEKDQGTGDPELPEAVPSMLNPNPPKKQKPAPAPTFNAQPRKERLFKL